MDNELLSSEHRNFYERFRSFWAAPSGPRVAEVIAGDATIHFTGLGTMSGTEYIDAMAAALASMPDMAVTPIDCAGSGEHLYIFWNATATINGARRAWHGVDRFKIQNGMAVEEYVIFDSAAMQGQAPA